MKPKISFLVINYNGKELLKKCLTSIVNNVSPDLLYEIIVVDDASVDGSAEMVKENFPQVKLIVNKREMFSDACLNKGLLAAKGEYVHFLMPDTELTLGTEEKLIEFLDNNKEVAGITSKIVYPDGRFQQNATRDHTLEEIFLNYTFLGKIFPIRKKIINYFYNYCDIKNWDENYEIENCGITHMIVRKKVIDKIGLFDWNIKMYFAENDFCMRIRKVVNGKIFYLNYGKVIHHLRGVVKKSKLKKVSKIYEEDSIKFTQKYYGLFWAVVLRLLLIISNILISIREKKSTCVLERFLVEPSKK